MKQLVLGGVKSGKSRFAEESAKALFDKESSEKVCVVVTAEPLDDEMADRIARHKAQRPLHWQSIEAPLCLSETIQQVSRDDEVDVVLIDCLTMWLTNHLVCEAEAEAPFDALIDALIDAVKDCSKHLILVSNETNMGVIPADALSRRFCDVAGSLHQRLAQVCDRVDLLVAGLPMTFKNEGQAHV